MPQLKFISKEKYYEMVNYFILKTIIKAGDFNFFKSLFSNFSQDIKDPKKSNYPLNYYLYKSNDKEMTEKLCNYMAYNSWYKTYRFNTVEEVFLPYCKFCYHPNYSNLLDTFAYPIAKNVDENSDCFKKLLKDSIFSESLKKFLVFFKSDFLNKYIINKIGKGKLTKEEIKAIGILKISEGLKELERIIENQKEDLIFKWEAIKAIYEINPKYLEKDELKKIIEENEYLRESIKVLKEDPNFEVEILDFN